MEKVKERTELTSEEMVERKTTARGYLKEKTTLIFN
jgi:hypothetical protein